MTTRDFSLIALPIEVQLRPATLDDIEGMAQVTEAIFAHQGRDRSVDREDLAIDLQEPDFDITRSTQIAYTEDGRIVAYILVYDLSKPPVSNWMDLKIHPDYLATSLGEHLIAWALERLQEAVERCPEDARVTVRSGSLVGYAPMEQLYEKMGMAVVRYFFRMLIEMEDAPPAPVMPEGMSIRIYRHPEDLHAMVETFVESFRDHWGFAVDPMEDEIKFWNHRIENDKLFDPSLVFLAVDDATGEVGGLCLCRTEEWSDPSVAYVADLGILRAYRKRGLALAMLHHAFGVLWERGRKRVALHVDASSLTGATRLYERAGMHINERSASYLYELRAGKDYTTQSVED